jgi:hypothetical protein
MRKSGWMMAGALVLLAAACSDHSVTTEVSQQQLAPTGASRNTGVTGAVFTSTNPSVDDPNTASNSIHDLCLNATDASPATDCNIYTEKQFVWLTGGPGPSDLADGTYMFAVLVPGGQGGNDAPNDCTDNNLSDIAPCSTDNSGAGDTWEHRVFSVASGVITYPASGYPGGHDFQNGMIRLMGYDNTTNPGGEYVMAVCNLADRDAEAENGPGVVPDDCKYDNFKVLESCTEDCGGGGTPQGASVVTEVHLADHTVIDGTNVAYLPAFGSIIVHDKATVTTTEGADIPAGSTVDFYFFSNGTCSTDPAAGPDSKGISGASPASVDNGLPQTISVTGSYSYKAFFYSGDLTAVTDAEGECEPFVVAAQLGKTMGFWGNKNGVAYITSHGGYAGNAVGIGRGSNIDQQIEALKVLPLTLNACGKGTPFIYTVGAQTANAACKLATGINVGTFNTNAAQLLALNYNVIFVPNFAGQTIGALGCTAIGSLSSSSTVNDAIVAATTLVDGSSIGGSTTQADLGAMNTLLGCLNRES